MRNKKNSALLEGQGLLKELEKCMDGKNGYIWLSAFKKFMRQEIPTWTTPTQWPVWKTLSNGFFKSADQVKATLGASYMEIFGRAETMMRNLRFRTFKPYGVDIAMVDIIDLGFNENQEVSYKDIIKTAKKKGLQECTPYDAFEIRLKYPEQPAQNRFDEYYIVVMRMIKGGVFHIQNSHGNLAIGVLYPRPDTMYNKYSKFFFRLTRKN
jgi:hypothetical protein